MNQAEHVAGGLNDSGLNLDGGSTSVNHVSTYVNLFFMTILLDRPVFDSILLPRYFLKEHQTFVSSSRNPIPRGYEGAKS